ncbi:Phage integrase [Sulfobacillus acidophilus TPY]|uniref:Integrase family protein n=1 Tax=Sulfobacillus acidophilus (strain ATCC 700253 / DSM 10332 / NAL) TaxID=679936 RepID=G8TVA1_SULAD|nr:Phage integrase [Sulfobacillus acidophilus TPY]AEW04741.1 integrase family protein [Sulfobacillus acidophilus DSM 10332]
MSSRPKEPHAAAPRKLPSGRWQARVTYWDRETGQRKELTRTFATEREAKKWAREEEVKLRETWLSPQTLLTLTVNNVLDQWLDAKRLKPVARSTLESYIGHLRHVRQAFGNQLVKDISPSDIQKLYASLSHTHSPRTGQYVATLLRSALDWAVTMDLIPTNPARKVSKPQVPRREMIVLTPEDATKLLRVAQQHRLYALWWFIALMGVRKGEALGLYWEDIDWNTKTVTIRRTLSGSGRRRYLSAPKTHHSTRTLAMPDILIQVLKQWKEQQQKDRIIAQTNWVETPYVFTTKRGTPWDASAVTHHFKRVLRQGDFPTHWRIHDLRHAMATHWLASGISPKVVSERLGHASVAFTLQVYAHALPHQQAEAAEYMAARLLGRSTHDPHEPT